MASTARDVGPLTLRAGVGGALFAHQPQKLFGWFGGHGFDATAGVFDQMGFQPGRANDVRLSPGDEGVGAGRRGEDLVAEPEPH